MYWGTLHRYELVRGFKKHDMSDESERGDRYSS